MNKLKSRRTSHKKPSSGSRKHSSTSSYGKHRTPCQSKSMPELGWSNTDKDLNAGRAARKPTVSGYRRESSPESRGRISLSRYRRLTIMNKYGYMPPYSRLDTGNTHRRNTTSYTPRTWRSISKEHQRQILTRYRSKSAGFCSVLAKPQNDSLWKKDQPNRVKTCITRLLMRVFSWFVPTKN
ncbi:hypothetical protein BaRGS_00004219 [Batillaria attramentaria]|uniref:Uncharacterized protein n=1 Tax=Batillaria attramentaria TaxID=370345 RepID=A0ABD0LY42_9CAEN